MRFAVLFLATLSICVGQNAQTYYILTTAAHEIQIQFQPSSTPNIPQIGKEMRSIQGVRGIEFLNHQDTYFMKLSVYQYSDSNKVLELMQKKFKRMKWVPSNEKKDGKPLILFKDSK